MSAGVHCLWLQGFTGSQDREITLEMWKAGDAPERHLWLIGRVIQPETTIGELWQQVALSFVHVLHCLLDALSHWHYHRSSVHTCRSPTLSQQRLLSSVQSRIWSQQMWPHMLDCFLQLICSVSSFSFSCLAVPHSTQLRLTL